MKIFRVAIPNTNTHTHTYANTDRRAKDTLAFLFLSSRSYPIRSKCAYAGYAKIRLGAC